jgi:hypothetical protein
MITKFTFPSECHLSKSVGSETNKKFYGIPKYMASKMLFWGDLYTIIYNFLHEDIETYEEAKAYFLEHIDFDCYTEFSDKKICLASSFYFYFDK